MTRFVQDRLALSAEQKKEIDALQKTADEAVAKVLTDEQKKTLRERSTFGPGGFAGMPAPGQVMSTSTQVALRPTSQQKTQLSDLQKTIDTKLEKVLTDDQKKQFKQVKADFVRGGAGGPGGGPPGGPWRTWRRSTARLWRPAGWERPLPGLQVRAGISRSRRQGIEAG